MKEVLQNYSTIVMFHGKACILPIPPAAKFTTGNLPFSAVSFRRGKETPRCLAYALS